MAKAEKFLEYRNRCLERAESATGSDRDELLRMAQAFADAARLVTNSLAHIAESKELLAEVEKDFQRVLKEKDDPPPT